MGPVSVLVPLHPSLGAGEEQRTLREGPTGATVIPPALSPQVPMTKKPKVAELERSSEVLMPCLLGRLRQEMN